MVARYWEESSLSEFKIESQVLSGPHSLGSDLQKLFLAFPPTPLGERVRGGVELPKSSLQKGRSFVTEKALQVFQTATVSLPQPRKGAGFSLIFTMKSWWIPGDKTYEMWAPRLINIVSAGVPEVIHIQPSAIHQNYHLRALGCRCFCPWLASPRSESLCLYVSWVLELVICWVTSVPWWG